MSKIKIKTEGELPEDMKKTNAPKVIEHLSPEKGKPTKSDK